MALGHLLVRYQVGLVEDGSGSSQCSKVGLCSLNGFQDMFFVGYSKEV